MPRAETVRGFKEILDGKCDDLRFSLAMVAIDRIPRVRVQRAGLHDELANQRITCQQHAYRFGIDPARYHGLEVPILTTARLQGGFFVPPWLTEALTLNSHWSNEHARRSDTHNCDSSAHLCPCLSTVTASSSRASYHDKKS